MRKLVVPFMTLVLGLTFASAADAQQIVTKPPTLKLSDPLPGNLFVELAKAINPAVVNISTSTLPRNMARDPFWDQLEQFYGMRLGPRQRSNKPMQTALGTGFVIREDGLIVTNAHVVRMADIVTVQFDEGSDKTYDAKVVGSDERSDIALLKIQADKKLPVAPLGSSADTEVGEWVAAFGNPFGHGHSVTKGIISSKARALEEINKFPLLQTDAAINPGNSGGALVNLRGELVGINSMIFSPSGASVGIGFAIPSDLAANVMRQLVEYGEVRRGTLGVDTQDITPELAAMLSVAVGKGTVITRVRKDAPAAKAGIQPGDVITAINDTTISSGQDLHNIEGLTPIGTPLAISLLRDGKPLTLRMTLAASTVVSLRGDDLDVRLAGVQLTDLDDSQRRPGLTGSVVKNVERASRAYASGLRGGDVIVGINQRDIEDTGDLGELLQSKPRQLMLTIVRGQSVFYLLLQ